MVSVEVEVGHEVDVGVPHGERDRLGRPGPARVAHDQRSRGRPDGDPGEVHRQRVAHVGPMKWLLVATTASTPRSSQAPYSGHEDLVVVTARWIGPPGDESDTHAPRHLDGGRAAVRTHRPRGDRCRRSRRKGPGALEERAMSALSAEPQRAAARCPTIAARSTPAARSSSTNSESDRASKDGFGPRSMANGLPATGSSSTGRSRKKCSLEEAAEGGWTRRSITTSTASHEVRGTQFGTSARRRGADR
jgi:hypothetical protein